MKSNLLILFILALLVLLALCGGSGWLPPHEFRSEGEWSPFFELRLIRVTAALVVGGSLALSGLVFQAILRNPLAEPFTLGLSGGAGVGAVLAFLIGLHAWTIYAVPLGAFVGALTVLTLVLVLNSGTGRSSESLLLSGVIAGTIASSVLMYLLSTADGEALEGVTWWMLGDLQAIDTDLLGPMALAALLALTAFRFFAGDLNALSLGDEAAFYLGSNPRRLLPFLVVLAALPAAATVALCGIIGFCGLIIPHIVRRLYGCNHRKIVVTAFLWGGGFLVLCDLLSRSLFPARELPIGVVTSLIGGPLFLWLLCRKKRHEA